MSISTFSQPSTKKWWLAWCSQFNLHPPYKLVASFPQRDRRVCCQNLLEKQRWFIYSIITADFNIVQHISCRCTSEFSQTVSQKQHAMNLSFEYTNVRKKYSDNKVDFFPPPQGSFGIKAKNKQFIRQGREVQQAYSKWHQLQTS